MVTQKRSAYCNPIWPQGFADPFVLKVRGRYYAYATQPAQPARDAGVFPILTSADLVEWQAVGQAMPALGPGYFYYWAPEVTEHNGQFFLYYAVHTSEFEGSIRVAVADRPAGPFVDSGRSLTSQLVPWAIDPHVLRDHDGQWYLYMTIEYLHEPHGYTGSGNAVVRLADPFTAVGELTRVTAPAHPWQLFEAKRPEKGGVDWYTVEGPAVLRHRQRYYQMYSGGCYYRANYAVSYAVSATPLGPAGLDDRSWSDWTGPLGLDENAVLLRGVPEHLIGPGHNSVVLSPSNAEQYLAYHAWQPDMIERRACIDRLFWHGEQLWTAAPTYTPQPVPNQPRLRELFEQNRLSPHWQSQQGSWQVGADEVIQIDEQAEQASLRHALTLRQGWLLEVNARALTAAGSYGVLLESHDQSSIRVVLTPDAYLSVWSSEHSQQPIQRVRLVGELKSTVWHQLFFALTGSVLSIQVDGLPALELLLKQSPQRFALLTELSQAAFTGISLTDHSRHEFLDARYTLEQLGWQSATGESAAWQIEDGALKQTASTQGNHTILQGSYLETFELGATMQLTNPPMTIGTLRTLRTLVTAIGRALTYGLTITYSKNTKNTKNAENTENTALLVAFSKQEANWALIVESQGMTPAIRELVPLPETFQPNHWHTLRAVQQAGRLEVYLDGSLALSLPTPTRAARGGLFTDNVAAAFTGVWQTGLC